MGGGAGLERLVPRWSDVFPAVMSPDNEDAEIVQMACENYLEQGYDPDQIPEAIGETYRGEHAKFRARAKTFTDPLRIYRMVRLNSPNDLRLDPIGTYWAWDARNVEPYGFSDYDQSGENFLLVGEVAADDVNWFETTLRNTVRASEQEITVKKGRPVRLLGIIDRDGNVVSTEVREARANRGRGR
jgi:hypothetical protein